MRKLLLLFLLGTMTMFSQTIKVRGTTLSYDKVKKTMTLTISNNTMEVKDKDTDVRVLIDKEFSLSLVINGVEMTSSDNFFKHEGHSIDGGWSFFTIKPSNTKELKMNYVYQFPNVEPGEYILTISDVCDNKWVTNKQSMSIIIE